MPPKGRKKAAVAATCSADVDAEFPPIEKILQAKSQPTKSGRGRKKAIVSDDETIVMGNEELEQKAENGAGDNGVVTELNGNGTPNNTEKEVDAFDRLLLDNTTKKDDWKLEFSPDASRLSQNGAKPTEKDSEEVKSNGEEALDDEADNDAKSLPEKSDNEEDPEKVPEEEIKETEPEDRIELVPEKRGRKKVAEKFPEEEIKEPEEDRIELVPEKRGRKKVAEKVSEEEIKETEPEEDKIELVPEKRGRKKVAEKVPEEEIKETEPEEDKIELVPEKRGRKKVAEKVAEDADTKEEPAETEKAPVKRGRKKATDPEEETEEVIETKEKPEKVVGRRGRKKVEEPTRVLAKRGQKKAEETSEADKDEVEEEIEEPVAKRPAAKSGRKKAEVEMDEETEEEQNEKPVARRGRMKGHEEESKREKELPKRGRKKAVEEIVAEEEPKAKRGRGKAGTDEVPEEPRAMRGRKKLEVVELEAEKPVEKRGRKKAEEPEKVTGKRGRKPAEVEDTEEPSKAPEKKGRKRKADGASDANKKGKEVEGDDISDFAGKELRVAMVRDPEIEEMAKRTSPPSGKRAGNEPKPADAMFVMAKPTKEQPAKSGRKRANQESEHPKPEKVKKEEPAKQGKSGAKKAQIPDLSSQDFGSEAKTSDGQPWNFKIASWNVNGIRAWVEKGGLSYLKHENPDVLCVQETKCSRDKLPEEVLAPPGYHAHWLAGDKEGYSGVGLISREQPISVAEGIGVEEHDNEGRVITAEYEKFYLVTTYVPNAGRELIRLDYRKTWDKDFRAYLKKLDEKKPVVLCGDLNVAHQEIDLANPKGNKKNAGFTQEERDGFSALLKEGFVDTFRHLHPEEKGAYTFWTYMMNARAKNVGWRLDYFVISERLQERLCDSFIRKDVMGSDHCPVGLLLRV